MPLALLRKVVKRSLFAAAASVLLLLVLYGLCYALVVPTEPVAAGKEVYISCGLGAPMETATRHLTGAGTCRVFGSYWAMAVFRLAFGVESLFRPNLLMRIEEVESPKRAAGSETRNGKT